MMKKMMILLVVLAFACSSLLFMTSCAKKQLKTEEGAKPAPAATMKKAEPSMAGEDEAAKKAEAERQARLRAEAEARKVRMEIQAFESGNIYFDFDKSELKPEARAVLEKKGSWLRAHPEFFLRIEGHCDERGTSEYNLALGERRANAALQFLNALGVSMARMSTMSYGEERPVDPGHSENAWAKNRRGEFKLMK
jgi:peptidoglycan-associated lipoprotein